MIPNVIEEETLQDLLIIFRFVSKLLFVFFFLQCKNACLIAEVPNCFLVKDHFYNPVDHLLDITFYMWSHTLIFLFSHKNNYLWIN